MDLSQSFQQYVTPRGADRRIDLDNYRPDLQKSIQLKNRLQQSGISNIPMPSVKRPIEEKISPKPFSARMNSSKIQSLSPLKKRIQDLNTRIIDSLNESYQQAAAQEAKYLGQGKAEFYKKQQIIIPVNPDLPQSVAGRKLQGRMGVSVGQPRMTGQLILTSTQRNTQLPPLDVEYSEKVQQQMAKTRNISPANFMSGPPALVYAGFEGGVSLSQINMEKARSKFLVDKLTGKFPDPRKAETAGSFKKQDTMQIDLTENEVDKGQKTKKTAKKVQTWTDLDKYIELLLESRSEEETVFQYLKGNKNGDPYDLQVVVFGKIKQDNDIYYTLSGKGITQYNQSGPVEFLSLGQWLLERDSYKHIRELDFFKQFKKWKFMRMWKKNIKLKKRSTASGLLEEKLFCLQDHFHESLLKHRKSMIRMSKETFIESFKQPGSLTESLKIENYKEKQQAKQEQCKHNIEAASEASRKEVKSCIEKVLKELRDRITGEIYLDETRKNQPNQNTNAAQLKRKEGNDVFTKLGFPPGMTYGHRSQLRKECIKFLRYAYLVDFLSMEALAKIYTNSVNEMLEKLRKLDSYGTDRLNGIMTMDFDDSGPTTAGQATNQFRPLFYISVQLNDSKGVDCIQEVPIDEFILPPRGESKVEDFDLIAHIEDEPVKPEKGADDSEEDDEAEEVVVQKYKKIVPNIHELWIQLSPNLNEFESLINKTFDQGLQCIKSFVRWNKHKDLVDYSKVLEDWDWEDTVGDDWDTPDTDFLDPDSWVHDDPIFKRKGETVKNLLNSAYNKAKKFLGRFQPLLEIYWRNKEFKVPRLLERQLKSPVDYLENTLKLLKYYSLMFKAKLPAQTDIGLLQLDSKAIKGKLIDTPGDIIKEIEKVLPEELRIRLKTSINWLNESTKKLQANVTNVEEFVVQLGCLKEINEKFQDYKDTSSLAQQMLEMIAHERETGIKTVTKEDQVLFKDAQKIINQLSIEISRIETNEEMQKDRFKKELEALIPILLADVQTLKEESEDAKYLDIEQVEDEMIKQLEVKVSRFQEIQNRGAKFNIWQEKLEIQSTPFNQIEELQEIVEKRHLLWKSRIEWKKLTDGYKKSLFKQINEKEIKDKCTIYDKYCNQLERALEPNAIAEELRAAVEDYKGAMPIVQALKNKNMTQEHWDQIKTVIGKKNFDPDAEGYTLANLLEEEVVPFMEQIVEISQRATGEANLDKQFKEVKDGFANIQFTIEPYGNDGKYTHVIQHDRIYEALDLLISQINTVLSNRYVAKIRHQAEETKKNLSRLQEFFEELVKFQKTWKYMEKIFSSSEIKQMLAQESQNFQQLSKFFEQTMTDTKKLNARIVQSKKGEQVIHNLRENNEKLDQINKALLKLLEEKRGIFPRLYFLSDDEVLDLISSSASGTADNATIKKAQDLMQSMLNKIFDGINRVKINNDQNQQVEGMESREKEYVQFTKFPKAAGPVEGYLVQFQNEMKSILTKKLGEGNKQYENNERHKWVMSPNLPGQVIATVAQIRWTEQTENAINEQVNDVQSLENHCAVQNQQIVELAKLVADPNLASLSRHILVALITVDVHARDIVDDLKNAQVQSTDDFMWKKQLRYYIEGQDSADCVIRQVQATLQYGFEYMGATSRLVITPLTDRCWITISMALHIQRGANPAGPAGTGKTESTKDLAKAIALFCYVFNCSDQVDYRLVGKLFSGLAQQGCWACLDEFNRIDVEVLSVIAQQLLTIRIALLKLKHKRRAVDDDGQPIAEGEGEQDTFLFEDQTIPIKKEFGVHITMNPGYAGRTELPDNLKILFRPVAMMVPSYRMIAEVMLAAEGFQKSLKLSHKMVQLYKLSSEQLSQQSHYDFGMRAVKSVLVMAGALKRANLEQDESDVLIRAMKDANVPKFLQQDLPLFMAIVQDLFPESTIVEPDYTKFIRQLDESLESKGLQTDHKVFKKKVIELLETFNVRFGVMLVGNTGSGKTRCFEVLQDAMTQLRKKGDPCKDYQKVTVNIINPKAITMGELYGEVDLDSQEWSDGLASKLMRAAAFPPEKEEEAEDRIWTVFDGPVDAIWIENMNTVLDDNKTLCLSNGQRIKLRDQMRMLFEVQDLVQASPATVSRCGMVYLTVEEMGWKPFVVSWIAEKYGKSDILSEELREHLQYLFFQTVDLGLEKIRSGLKEPIKTTDLQQVKGLCAFLESFLQYDKGFKGDDKTKKKDMECIFAFSYAWGLGASLDLRGKDVFDAVVRDQFKSCSIPAGFTVFDYFYDLRKDKIFKPWQERVEKFEYDKTLPYFELIVPTDVTFKHRYCMEQLLFVQKPFFFTGDTGVGKSVIVNSALKMMSEREEKRVMPIMINFSAKTSAERTQQSMLAKTAKMRTNYTVEPGYVMNAVFVDDINMPAVEQYGAQPPIELLRLFLNMKGVYEKTDWTWKEVKNTTLIAGAAPPGGSRAELTPRFTNHFNMFCLPPATEGMLQKIFGEILGGFLKTGFPEKVQGYKDAAVISTITVYQRIISELRATPSKFHYTYNLRDVSKVFQGILMTKSSSIIDEVKFTRLWINETFRVFGDRLINEQDTNWFIDLMMELLNGQFRISAERKEYFEDNKVMFGDILKLDAGVRLYEEITQKEKLKKTLFAKLEDYNTEMEQRMNLVFFDDAMHHILRITRALRQPRGNIMLIGVGGSGKQSLTKLSAYMYQIKYRTVEVGKGFNLEKFRDNIRDIMFATAGVEKEKNLPEPTAFTLTDSQIVDEAFLEDINNILNTGEIPNLMSNENKEKIQNEMRIVVQEMKKIDTVDEIQKTFVDRVREHFHICLCMSPVGDDLRVRCRQFPSLVNCCTLDWFSRWPREALLYVSSEFLKEVEMPSEEIRSQVSQMCMLIHTSVEEMSIKFWEELRRRVYTTPKSYLDLIKLYIGKLAMKRQEDNANRDRLDKGVKKLIQTNANIDELNKKLTEMQPELKKKEANLKIILEKVEIEKAIADQEEEKVSGEKDIVEQQTREAEKLKAMAEDELAAAKPLVDSAIKAVGKVEASAISEIKALPKPPDKVMLVLEVVMLYFGKKTDWDSAKKEMGNAGQFLAQLKELAKDENIKKIKEKALSTIRKKYLEDKERWDLKQIETASKPARNIAEWAQALSDYQKVYLKIQPLIKEKNEKTAEVEAAQKVLAEKMKKVYEVKEKVAKLEQQVKELNQDKAETEFTIRQSEERMRRANTLVKQLADEGIRWKEDVEKMTQHIQKLVGNVFLACACISYFGAFTGDYRKQLTDMWTQKCLERKVPTSEIFSLPDVLGDPVVIRDWNIKGLPTDLTSAENGILAMSAERYGLCIDPQMQANKWLTNMFKDNRQPKPELLKLKTFEHKNFLRQVCNAVLLGNIVLIEDITEDISPAIDSILLHQEFKDETGQLKIKLDEKFQDFDRNFRLFMTTKMANPEYKPEVCIKVTIINFTVTAAGLEEQLLGDVVVKEKPEVERKRDKIVLQMASDKAEIKRIENTILSTLNSSTLEDILDKDDLIDMLQQSKQTAGEIESRMKDAEITNEDINNTRAVYKDVAVRGSILYFVIADMARINDMYQNSLQFVKALFNKAIDASKPSDDQQQRLNNLIDTITKTVYTNICRGLFERDKLIFSFLIGTSIKRNTGEITPVGWSLILRGAMPFSEEQASKKPPNPFPKLLTKLAFDLIYSAQLNIVNFAHFIQSLDENKDVWEKWATCENPHSQKLPLDWETKLTDFQKMIVLKAFRPEMLMFAFQGYIIRHLGQFFVESPSVQMRQIYEDMDKQTPLVFVLSTGADPTLQLDQFADFMGATMKVIALGQGQSEKAVKLIHQCSRDGNWVLLQNCHLARTFMPTLESEVLRLQTFAEENDDPDVLERFEKFRLFLTSMPAPYFPVTVLQNSIKMTTEPPRGIKANLKRTYADLSDEKLDDCKKPEIYKRLLFGLSFFHALSQERRKFGPLGFNNVYEFNDSDLETSMQMLRMFLDEQDDIPWDSLNYMTGEINYGGRVTDHWDLRCLMEMLKKFYCLDALDEGYIFDDEGVYYCPKADRWQDYIDYIDSLPLVDNPSVFGLSSNANISYQLQESGNIVETVLSIQPRISSSGGGPSPEQMVLDRIKNLKATVPELLDQALGKKELFKQHNGLYPSLTTVLLQEMEKFNRLLKKIAESLNDLQDAIGGFIVMSEVLDSMNLRLLNGQVPLNWEKVAYPSLKPLSSWYTDLQARVAFLQDWLENGNPKSYWISGFFFPQGFNTGVLQTHARQNKIAIDELDWQFEVLKQETPEELDQDHQVEFGVIIHGFFIDGARWNREDQCLDDQIPGELYDMLPLIHFKPVKKSNEKNKDDYECPAYKTGARKGTLSTTGLSTNMILGVWLPTSDHHLPEVWVRRAAALLCQLND